MQTKRRIVVVHNAAQALAAAAAAAETARPVLIRSADGAAGYAGALWFQELIKLAQSAFPNADVQASLDCGDAPGHALGALRQGLKLVRLRARPSVRAKVAAIARQLDAALDDAPGPVLDLLDDPDPAGACRTWLGTPPRPARRNRKGSKFVNPR